MSYQEGIKLPAVNSQGAAVPLNVDAAGNLITIPAATSVQRFSAGGAAPGQSIKTFNNTAPVSINTGATVNVYTVTTGKTFYISDIYIGGDFTVPVEVKILAGATVILDAFVKGDTAPLSLVGIESQPTVGSGVVLSIVFPTLATKNATYFIGGFEQ